MFNPVVRIWEHRGQFAKFFFVGISGFTLDLLLLIFFKEILHWNPVLGVVIDQIFVMIYNFTMNKYWSFGSHDMPHRQLMRYLIVAGANYIFGVVVMYIFSHIFGFDYRLVRIGTVALMMCWNFFLYKYWIYAVIVV